MGLKMTVEQIERVLALTLRVERDVYGTLRVAPSSIEEAARKIAEQTNRTDGA